MNEVGKFGLPLPPSPFLSELAPERLERIASVKALVLVIFNLTKVHLGEEEARKLFVLVAGGKKGKREKHEVNSALLEFYDAVVATNPEKASSAPRQIAERLYKMDQTKYGASEPAIIKQIGRLVTAREAKDIQALEDLEAIRSDGNFADLEFIDLAIESLKGRISGHRPK
jgi:hypothetical protein